MILTLPPLQGFISKETDFHLLQFLSNFFRYLASNFPSSHPYSNLAIYFLSNSLLLYSSLSYHLTSIFNLPLNSSTNSFAFSKSSSFSHVLFSAINSFHHTKYFSTPLCYRTLEHWQFLFFFTFIFLILYWFSFSFLSFFFWTIKRHVTLQLHDMSQDMMS